jgi:hypothetical protein
MPFNVGLLLVERRGALIEMMGNLKKIPYLYPDEIPDRHTGFSKNS